MKTYLAVALLVTLAVPADAGGRRRAAASPSGDELTIRFVGVSASGSDAVVDAGGVSRKRIRRRFGIHIDAPGRTGTAVLTAFLETTDDRCVIRVNGRKLGSTPIVIDAQARLGEVTMHTLEIEVPPSVPEGAFASAVRWEVTTP